MNVSLGQAMRQRMTRSGAVAAASLLVAVPALWAFCARSRKAEDSVSVAHLQGTGLVTNLLRRSGSTYGTASYLGSKPVLYLRRGSGGAQSFPVPEADTAAWALSSPRDGRVYVGTDRGAVDRFDPETKRWEVLDKVPGETMIWQFAIGSDGNVYGCTYPNAKLIRVEVPSGKVKDLGRIDPDQPYARELATSDDGYVYVWTGLKKLGIYAYRISDGRSERILPDAYQGAGFSIELRRGVDGKVYTAIRQGGRTDWFLAEGFGLSPISANQVKPPEGSYYPDANRRGVFRIREGAAITDEAVAMPTRPQTIFRVGASGDGKVYVSSAMPAVIYRLNPATGTLTSAAELGRGEAYSIVGTDRGLVMGVYAGTAPLFLLDKEGKLRSFRSDQIGRDWRPLAAAQIGGTVYFGSLGGYSTTTGVVAALDLDSGKVTVDRPVSGEGIVSVARLGSRLVLGTFAPDTGAGQVILWDPEAHRAVWSTRINGAAVTDLTVTGTGQILGFAGNRERMREAFLLDARSGNLIRRKAIPDPMLVNSRVYNTAQLRDQLVYFLGTQGLATVDPASLEFNWVGRHSIVTSGAAFVGNEVYFGSEDDLRKFRLP